MNFIEDIIKDGKSPILRVKYCETVNARQEATTAYAVTDAVNANMYDRIDAMSKLIGKELPNPEPEVIKGYQRTKGGVTANSYIEDDIKFLSEDRFLGIFLKEEELDALYSNGWAGRRIYMKYYLILRYPEEMKNWDKISE